ncbi:MAG: 6-bladed beta-propeller [Balneolaceae bacterium]
MNNINKYYLSGIFLFLFLTGCVESRNGVDIPEHIQNLDGLTVYDRGEEPVTEIDFQKEQVFGDLDDVHIGNLWAFDVDKSGRVYIADVQEMDIKVYDSEGKFLSTLGREGSGPGEFRELSNIQIMDNLLFVFDRNQQRILKYDTESRQFVNDIGIAGNRSEYEEVQDAHLNNIFIRDNFSFLMEFSKSRMPENANTWDHFPGSRMYYLLDTDGNISSVKLLETKSTYQVLVPMAGRSIGTPVDFFGNTLIQLSGENKILIAWSEEFLVKKYSSSGEYMSAFYRPLEREEFTPEHSFEGADEDFIEEAARSIDFPKTWPALNDLLVDDENRLWVSTIVEDFDVYEWWVLKSSGEVIAKFEWPRDKPIRKVKNGYAYTLETEEETGLQTVVRYSIEMD